MTLPIIVAAVMAGAVNTSASAKAASLRVMRPPASARS